MNNIIAKINNIIIPVEKTIIDECKDYIKENSSTIIKGTVASIAIVYTAPIVIGAITILPYIGAGYYIYSTINSVHSVYSWSNWIKNSLSR